MDWSKLNYRKASTDSKKLIDNFISLSFLQAGNYILPLLTVPYLVRVFGPEKFGLVAFAQAFIQYFVIFVEYGFNLSATRRISIYRDDQVKISRIFSTIMLIKTMFMVSGFLILLTLVFTIAQFRSDWQLYLLTYGITVGNVLFPIWFFQGMEEMRYITLLNILAKTIFTLATFIFVQSQSDFIYVPIVNSVGYIFAGLIGLWVALSKFNIVISKIGLLDIREELHNGWHVFISTAAISLFTSSNIFILGLFCNKAVVGYYSGGEKIVRAVSGLAAPVAQSIYPHVSRLAKESKEKTLIFLKNVTIFFGILMSSFSLLLLIEAELIVKIILGVQFLDAVPVVQILSLLPLSIFLNNIFGTQIMLNFGMEKAFSRITIKAGIMNIILVLILSSLLKHIGVAWAVLITELYICVAMYLHGTRKGYRLFSNRWFRQ